MHPLNLILGILGAAGVIASHTIIKDPDLARFVGELGATIGGGFIIKRIADINPKKSKKHGTE